MRFIHGCGLYNVNYGKFYAMGPGIFLYSSAIQTMMLKFCLCNVSYHGIAHKGHPIYMYLLYAIIFVKFAYRYFGLGAEIREGLIFLFF